MKEMDYRKKTHMAISAVGLENHWRKITESEKIAVKNSGKQTTRDVQTPGTAHVNRLLNLPIKKRTATKLVSVLFELLYYPSVQNILRGMHLKTCQQTRPRDTHLKTCQQTRPRDTLIAVGEDGV